MPKRLIAEPAGVPLGGRRLEVVLIGASAGGPNAIQRILADLPWDFPAPVVVCQHMPTGFTQLWAERLDEHCSLSVREARNGQLLKPRTVTLAPIGKHLRFHREGPEVSVALVPDTTGSLHVPSIDVMFSSAAHEIASKTLAVLLTGLGSDGAAGLLAIRRAGGYTIAETRDSALSYSMPGAAVEIGAAYEEASIDEMGALIKTRVAGEM